MKRIPDCHAERPHRARGLCGSCYMAWLRKTNPEVDNKIRSYQQSDRYKDLRRSNWLKVCYGITLDKFNEMWDAQGKVCAICRQSPKSEVTRHVDHNHSTGQVRGILCIRCNLFTGYIEKNKHILEECVRYITKFEVKK